MDIVMGWQGNVGDWSLLTIIDIDPKPRNRFIEGKFHVIPGGIPDPIANVGPPDLVEVEGHIGFSGIGNKDAIPTIFNRYLPDEELPFGEGGMIRAVDRPQVLGRD